MSRSSRAWPSMRAALILGVHVGLRRESNRSRHLDASWANKIPYEVGVAFRRLLDGMEDDDERSTGGLLERTALLVDLVEQLALVLRVCVEDLQRAIAAV